LIFLDGVWVNRGLGEFIHVLLDKGGVQGKSANQLALA
jgi:hypothetical protein